MATKSEDIRLSVNNVRHKKGDGTLYLMAERLAFMPNTKNNFTISHKYSDIKTQKISPEGKPKIQLQIVLHTGDNTIFQFANLEDRTIVKDALLQILPQFKGKMPKDRERKAIMLSKNPHLLQLYKDLVETKIVAADDFWSQFVDEQSDSVEIQPDTQDVGVSGNFLAGIPLNGKQVTGTVSNETLMAICKTYPRVAKKHQELVPEKMSEQEFWNKFFQSRYFNRDRIKGDPFSDCVKSDEKEWSSVSKVGALDPFLDIDLFNDNAYQGTPDDPTPGSSHDNQDQLLMRRFNQQSIRLLESLQSKSKGAPAKEVIQNGSQTQASGENQDVVMIDANGRSNRVAGAVSESAQHGVSFRDKRRDWSYYDLAGDDMDGDLTADPSRIGTKMNDVNRDKYSIVPQAQQTTISVSAAKEHAESLKTWNPILTESIADKDATEALKNFAPGGYLMKSTNNNRLEDTVPEELQKKLKATYHASNELLRHFWLCFPAVEPSLETKLMKIHETLKKFEATKLQTLHDSLPRDQRHLLNHIMRGQIKAANRKFEMWKNKRRQRESVQ